MNQTKGKKRDYTSDSSFEASEKLNQNKTRSKPECRKSKQADTKQVDAKTSESNGQQVMTSFASKTPVTPFDSMTTSLKEMNERQEQMAKRLNICITENDFIKYMDKIKTEIIGIFNEKVEKLESRVFELESEHEKLKKSNVELRKNIELLSGELRASESKANMAMVRSNNLEQYTRKDSVRIFE